MITRSTHQRRQDNPEPHHIVVRESALKKVVQSLLDNCGVTYQHKADNQTSYIVTNPPISDKVDGPRMITPDTLVGMLLSKEQNRDNSVPGSYSLRSHTKPPKNSSTRVGGVRSFKPIPAGEVNRGSVRYVPEDGRFSLEAQKPLLQASLRKEGKVPLFYTIEVLRKPGSSGFEMTTAWARGHRSKTVEYQTESNAIKAFQERFTKMTGLDWEYRKDSPKPGKYTFDNILNNKAVKELIQLIFNEEGFNEAKAALDYNGALSCLKRDDINKRIKTLSKVITSTKRSGTEIEMVYNILPGKSINLKDLPSCEKGKQLLHSIQEIKNAHEIMEATHNSGRGLQLFNQQLETLGLKDIIHLCRQSEEFEKLSRYLSSQGRYYQFRVKDIFRFSCGKKQSQVRNDENSTRLLLWHGSRAINYITMLSHGLQTSHPEVKSKMFDNDIHLTDRSYASAEHCETKTDALLLLCEVKFDTPIKELTKAHCNQNETGLSEWIDAGYLHHSLGGVKMLNSAIKPGMVAQPKCNEYTCDDPTRIKPRYIIRFDATMVFK